MIDIEPRDIPERHAGGPRPAQPEEAAGPVLFLCSEHANYVHGQILNVTGGQFGGMYT